MAVDLTDLVENLRRECEPPGGNLYAGVADSEFEGYMTDSFWELVLDGYISGYTEDEGIVTEDAATPDPDNDLGREYQQLIILNAGIKITRIKMVDLDTLFRSVAGPVEFETRKTASLLQEVLNSMQERFDKIVEGLPDATTTNTVYYLDVATQRACDDPTFQGY